MTATRNRTDLLRRSLMSIAAQSFRDYEAIIVDDGSDEEVGKYHNQLLSELPSQFRLFRNRPPGSAGAGPGPARNAGIARAQGQYLAFLDDDDYWIRDDHLSVAAEAVQRANADFYFANMQGIRFGKVVRADWFEGARELTSGPFILHKPVVHKMPLRSFFSFLHRHFSHPDCWIVRRTLVQESGGFWDKVRIGEDYSLLMRIADRANTVLYRPDCVTAYRFPEGNSISLTSSMLEEHLQFISSAIHVRVTAKRPEVRQCGRAKHGWHLRQIALELLEKGDGPDAMRFAREALVTYPTFGGAGFLARTVGKAIIQLISGRPRKTICQTAGNIKPNWSLTPTSQAAWPSPSIKTREQSQ